MKLHGYFRSSASYRVRIALNLKGLSAEHLSHHLRKGEQRAPDYLALNPQGLVPTVQGDAGSVLTQSLAIIEWLDETHPEPPLLPKDPLRRAQVRAFAQAIACDIHPIQNLKILARLRELGLAGRAGDGLGGMGQPRRPCRVREADRQRSRTVLLRRCADDRRSLSGAATRQCAPLRRRCRGVPAPVESGSGRERHSRRSPTPHRSDSPMPNKPDTVTMDAVYTAPGYLFRRMQQIAVAIFIEECKAFDLTPVQYAALIAIRTHPGIDATRLSAVIAFDRSTLGSVIERLEAKSYIERKPAPEDKRVKLLVSDQGWRQSVARHHARRSIGLRRGCCSR